MKLIRKLLSFLLSFVLILPTVFSICPTAAAITITDGDFTFSIDDDGNCLVYSYLGNDKDIILPKKVFDKSVIGVDDNCFSGSDIKSVSIPDSYSFLGDSSFYDCDNLTTLVFPESLKTLGILSFAKCDALESIEIKNCNYLKTINYGAFLGDINLKAVELPKGLNKISESAFSDSGLEKIEIPDSVSIMEDSVFKDCESLSEIILPRGLNSIPAYAFYNSAVENVALPEGVAALGKFAFAECKYLSDIDLPISLKTIGENCFYNDTSLKNLFLPDTITSMGANCLAPMSYNKTIEVTCYDNSYSADFCYENMVLNLVTIEKIPGDVNLNGKVEILDVTQIQKYKIGEDTIPSYRAKELADVNKDGKITVRDATLIQMYLAKIIENFD